MRNITTSKMSMTDKIILNHNTAIGLPMGLSLNTADLPVGMVVMEATPLTKPENGIRKVCKFAKAISHTNDKTIINKDTNPFKVGDIVTAKIGGKAYAISAITAVATNSAQVELTYATATDNPITDGDGFLYLAKASGAASSEKAQTADVLMKFYAKVGGEDILFDQAAYTQVVQLAKGFIAPAYIKDLEKYAIREIEY